MSMFAVDENGKYKSRWASLCVWVSLSLLVVGLIGFALWLPSVFAQTNTIDISTVDRSYTCVDANTLNSTFVQDGDLHYFTTTCTYGCDANMNACKPHPIVQNAVFVAFAGGVVILFAFLWKHG